jgi:branched-chain amino acid aminotransferase
MRDIFLNHNGKLVKADTPVVTAQNRGLRYGDGLFETLRLKDGRLARTDEHFARLWKGMELLQMAPPKHFTPELLEKSIHALAAKNHHPAARVRLTVYRGDGGLYDPQNHQPHYLIETMPLPQASGQWNSNGLVLGIYTDVVKSCDAVANIKHNNYLPYLMAALHAKAQQWNDAVVLNMHGRLCDTTIANLFMIKNQVVFTPSLAEGCVAGTMRKEVLALLRQAGWQVAEAALTPEALLHADEVFVTNAIYGLRWVQRVADTEYGNALTQQIFALLQPTI